MSAFNDTTTHPWIKQPDRIELRRSERKDTRQRDFRAAHGIILATMIGANLIVWGYVALRWTLSA